MKLLAVMVVSSCYQPVTLGPDAGGYDGVVLADHPISFWPMDDATATTVRDVVGNAPGTATGSCMFGVSGVLPIGAAIGFANRDCAIDVGDGFGFAGTAPFTIEAWVQFDQTETMPFREVFAREQRATGPVDGYGLVFRDAQHVFFERVASTVAVTTGDATVDGSFHDVVVSYGAPDITLYVDGVAATTAIDARPLASPTVHALIGAASASESHFTGFINNVAVYDHALSPERVAAHFAAAH